MTTGDPSRLSGLSCTALTLGLDLPALMKWARAIARGIRHHYRFQCHSQEEQELEAVAYYMLCRCLKKFDLSRVPPGGDVDGAFRGWCHPFIRGECQCEARRLRNGGTYNTRTERLHRPIYVEPLPRRRGDDGDEYVDIADYRAERDD